MSAKKPEAPKVEDNKPEAPKVEDNKSEAPNADDNKPEVSEAVAETRGPVKVRNKVTGEEFSVTTTFFNANRATLELV